jgi:hypothetical protein
MAEPKARRRWKIAGAAFALLVLAAWLVIRQANSQGELQFLYDYGPTGSEEYVWRPRNSRNVVYVDLTFAGKTAPAVKRALIEYARRKGTEIFTYDEMTPGLMCFDDGDAHVSWQDCPSPFRNTRIGGSANPDIRVSVIRIQSWLEAKLESVKDLLHAATARARSDRN